MRGGGACFSISGRGCHRPGNETLFPGRSKLFLHLSTTPPSSPITLSYIYIYISRDILPGLRRAAGWSLRGARRTKGPEGGAGDKQQVGGWAFMGSTHGMNIHSYTSECVSHFLPIHVSQASDGSRLLGAAFAFTKWGVEHTPSSAVASAAATTAATAADGEDVAGEQQHPASSEHVPPAAPAGSAGSKAVSGSGSDPIPLTCRDLEVVMERDPLLRRSPLLFRLSSETTMS